MIAYSVVDVSVRLRQIGRVEAERVMSQDRDESLPIPRIPMAVPLAPALAFGFSVTGYSKPANGGVERGASPERQAFWEALPAKLQSGIGVVGQA